MMALVRVIYEAYVDIQDCDGHAFVDRLETPAGRAAAAKAAKGISRAGFEDRKFRTLEGVVADEDSRERSHS